MRLAVSGLCRSYGLLPVLRDVSLTVSAGEILAVTGSSGTGKSTLLQCLGLLDRPDAGTIRLDGDELTTLSLVERTKVRARRIGFIFQSFHLLPDFTVAENILMSARAARLPLEEAQQRMLPLLDRLGLRRPHQQVTTLSGGERQRVAIARALLTSPSLLLADEPTGNLDPALGAVVLAEIISLTKESGAAAVVVTHDPVIAARCDRHIRLSDARSGLASKDAAGGW
jgi:ABC-type lipoprotein export system ATPase subunit